MARVGVSLSTQGAREYRALAKRIRKAKATDLRKELRDAISTAGKPVVGEVRDAVLSIPITSHGGGGLRRKQFAQFQAEQNARRRGKDTEAAIERAGRRDHGLRRSIARAVKLENTARGVRIVVRSASLPESQRTLPRHLDSEKGWRHPVFGNRETWVTQRGRPYFASTISKRAPAFRRSILDAMERVTEKLDH